MLSLNVDPQKYVYMPGACPDYYDMTSQKWQLSLVTVITNY